MATDRYGNAVSVGDTVTKVGSSDEFVVSSISGLTGEDLLDLDGSWHESRVHPSNVIVK